MNYTALAIVAATVIIIGVVHAIDVKRKSEAKNPFKRAKEETFCPHGHNWEKALFLTSNQLAAFQADPKSFERQMTTYCLDCGYVPGQNVQVKPAYLEDLRAQVAAGQRAEQRKVDLDSLMKEFFARYLEAVPYKNQRDQDLLAEGFLAHDRFVNALPALLAAKELSRQRAAFVEQMEDAERKNA